MGNGQFGMYFVGSGPPPGNRGDDAVKASCSTNRAVSRDYERVLYKTGRFPYAQSKSASPSDTPKVTNEASTSRLNTCGPLLGTRPVTAFPQRYDSSTTLGKGNISAFPMVGRNLGLSYNRVFRHHDDFHLNYKENYTSAVVKPLFPYPGYACHPCSYGSEDFGTCPGLIPPNCGGYLTSSYLSSGRNALKCVTDNFTSSICDSGTCSDYTPVVKVSKACNSFPKDPKGCQTDPSPWVLNENLRNGKLMVVTPNSRFTKPVGVPATSSTASGKPQSEGVYQPHRNDKKGGGGISKGAQTNPGAPVDDSNGPYPGQNDLVESFPFDPYGTGAGVPANNFGRPEDNAQGGANRPINGTGLPTTGSNSPAKIKSQTPSVKYTSKPIGIVKPTVSSSKSTGPGKTPENGGPGTENKPFRNGKPGVANGTPERGLKNATTGSDNTISNKPGKSAGNEVPMGNHINPETGKPFPNGANGSPGGNIGSQGIPFGNSAPSPTSGKNVPEMPVKNGKSVPKSGNYGTQTGNLGPSPGNMGPAPGNMGPVPGNMGPVLGNMGPAPGNMGPVLGNMEPAPGNMGPAPGNLGPASSASPGGTYPGGSPGGSSGGPAPGNMGGFPGGSPGGGYPAGGAGGSPGGPAPGNMGGFPGGSPGGGYPAGGAGGSPVGSSGGPAPGNMGGFPGGSPGGGYPAGVAGGSPVGSSGGPAPGNMGGFPGGSPGGGYPAGGAGGSPVGSSGGPAPGNMGGFPGGSPGGGYPAGGAGGPAPMDGNYGHAGPSVKNGTPLHSQGPPAQTYDNGKSFKNESPGPGSGGRRAGNINNTGGNGVPGSGGGNNIPGISGNSLPGVVNGSKQAIPNNAYGKGTPTSANQNHLPIKPFGNASPVSGNTHANNGPGAISGQNAPRKPFGNGTPTPGSKSGTAISPRPLGNQVPGPNGVPSLGNGIGTSNSVAGFQRKPAPNNANNGGGNPFGNGTNVGGPPKQWSKTYNGGQPTGSSVPPNPATQRKPSNGKSIRETLPRPTQSSPNTKDENNPPKRKSNKGLFRHPESTNGPRRTNINGGNGKPPEASGSPRGSRAQVAPVPNNGSRTRNNGLPPGGMVNNGPVGLGNGVTNSSPNVAYQQPATAGRNPEIAYGFPNPNPLHQSLNSPQNRVTPIPPTKITPAGLQNGDSGVPGLGYNYAVPMLAAPNRQTDATQNPIQPFQNQSQNNGTTYPPPTFPNTPDGQINNGRNIPAFPTTGNRPIALVAPIGNPADAATSTPAPHRAPQNQQQSNGSPYPPAPFILVSRPSITKGVQTEPNTNPVPETPPSTPPPPPPSQNRPIYTAKKLEGDDSPPYFTPTPIQRGKKLRNQLPARNIHTASSSGSSPERSYPNPHPASAPTGSRPGHWQIPWSAGSSPERSTNTQPKVGGHGGTNPSSNNGAHQAPNQRPSPQIAVVPPAQNLRPAPQIAVVAPVSNPKSPEAINQQGGLKRYPSKQGPSKDGPVFMARKQSINQLKESLSRNGGPKSGNQHNLQLPPGQNVPLKEKRSSIQGVLTIPSKLSVAALRQGDIKIARTSVVKREMAEDENSVGENYITLPRGNPSRMRLVSALKKPPAGTIKPTPNLPTTPNPKEGVTRSRSVHFKGVPPTP
ncbi:unnamed protein product [Orchesella dallaii]|uniref:Uncharacterized protein n=1 Tax=Orchesella dallaii TaxID=48710 RepID=A0ABP1Q3V7_9HEXA